MSDQEALKLKAALQETAAKLGLRIHVTYDEVNAGYYIDAGIAQPPRAGVLVDEEVLMAPSLGPQRDALARLLTHELQDLQTTSFSTMAEHLQKYDWRERVYALSYEDKKTLSNMYQDALSTLRPAREGTAKLDKYQALMDRLLK